MKTDKILIVGGGSAGWMTAATLVKAFPNKDITVIESPNIPTVGVGESTISKVKQWTKFLGIDDKEFLKHTDGTIKFSIKFTDFNGKDEAGFHYPFGPVITEGTQLNYNDWWIKKEFYPETPVSDYAESFAPNMALVNQRKGAFKFHNFELDRDSAYQFDATKFGLWLKDHYCLPRGVKHIQEDIIDVPTNENGIKCVVTKTYSYYADLFVDCTGFKSMLLGGALKEPFETIKNLPNNKAWATRIPYVDKEKEVECFTNCTAIENGWVWNIPLWSRVGTGYVYSDKFVDDETALQEFKNHLDKKGQDYSNAEFKKIKMRVGIHKRLWVKNVVGIGLAAGFIEPLESNGLFSVHEFLMRFIRNAQRDIITQWDRDNFTFQCKKFFRNFAEFVAMHYAMSNRDDTEYWRANANKVWDKNLPDLVPVLQDGFSRAAADRDFIHRFNDGGLHCIAFGMEWYPTEATNVKYYQGLDDNEFKKQLINRVIALNNRKKEWNLIVQDKPSFYDYHKNRFYNDN